MKPGLQIAIPWLHRYALGVIKAMAHPLAASPRANQPGAVWSTPFPPSDLPVPAGVEGLQALALQVWGRGFAFLCGSRSAGRLLSAP